MISAGNSVERRSARFWLFFILGLMGVNFLMAGIALYIAVGDPSFRPMPGYGLNAVDWETRKAQQAESDALHWTVDVKRSEGSDSLQLRIREAQGAPVAGGTGIIRCYHFTRAGNVQEARLEEIAPGTYLASVDVARDGRWQLEVEMTRETGERFYMDRAYEWYRP